MRLDDLDLEILRENFSDETISKIDINNVYKIFKYLEEKSKNKISYYTYGEKTVTQDICDKKENFFGYITYEYK